MRRKETDTFEKKEKEGKKKGTPSWLVILIFIIGVCILLYPTVSNLWNQYRNSKLAVNYDNSCSKLSNKAVEEMWNQAVEYNQNHSVNTIIDAFGKQSETMEHNQYEKLLNPCGNGIMATLTIPSIKETMVCYHGLSDEALSKGCGHMEGTSLPVGMHGDNGSHTVFAAHRGLPSAKLFTDLDKVKEGDIFFFTVLEHNIAYEVDQIKTVKPGNFQYLNIEAGKDYATLVTCTPYAVNTHRLLVRGHRVPYSEEKAREAKAAVSKDLAKNLLIIGSLISFILVCLIGLSYRNKTTRKKEEEENTAE